MAVRHGARPPWRAGAAERVANVQLLERVPCAGRLVALRSVDAHLQQLPRLVGAAVRQLQETDAGAVVAPRPEDATHSEPDVLEQLARLQRRLRGKQGEASADGVVGDASGDGVVGRHPRVWDGATRELRGEGGLSSRGRATWAADDHSGRLACRIQVGRKGSTCR